MWGTLICRQHSLYNLRFIPTRVGNSTACRLYQQCQPVHPHACGELTTFRLTESTSCGSSPRVWGTQLTGADDIDNRRFIPTRVGNSCFLAMMMCYLSVHPHACGELPRMKIGIISFTGSSPRVWGTRQNRENRYRLCRFIPTRVGNSRDRPYDGQPHTVHPHACGELSIMALIPAQKAGSSPRVWGTLQNLPPSDGLIRFIPTRVGNSFSITTLNPSISVHPHACGELSVLPSLSQK